MQKNEACGNKISIWKFKRLLLGHRLSFMVNLFTITVFRILEIEGYFGQIS